MERTIKKKRPIVIVEWGDAHAGARWNSEDDMMKRPLFVTWIGYLVSSNEEGVSLAFGFDENDHHSGHMFVPRGMIRKITKIKY